MATGVNPSASKSCAAPKKSKTRDVGLAVSSADRKALGSTGPTGSLVPLSQTAARLNSRRLSEDTPTRPTRTHQNTTRGSRVSSLFLRNPVLLSVDISIGPGRKKKKKKNLWLKSLILTERDGFFMRTYSPSLCTFLTPCTT